MQLIGTRRFNLILTFDPLISKTIVVRYPENVLLQATRLSATANTNVSKKLTYDFLLKLKI